MEMEMEFRDGRKKMGGKGKGNKIESRCVVYIYLLPKMTVNFMWSKHVLIKKACFV